MGTPALAHMAAALAFAISSSWALSSSVRRGGVLLGLLRVLDIDLLLLSSSTGDLETLLLLKDLDLLQRSMDLLRYLALLLLSAERDLLPRDTERDFLRGLETERVLDLCLDLERLARVADLDLERFFAGDLDLDRFLLAGDLDFERLFLPRDLDFDRFFLTGDLDFDRFLLGDLDFDRFFLVADLDLFLLMGDLDFDRLLVGDLDFDLFFLAGDLDLDRFCFIGDLDLDLFF